MSSESSAEEESGEGKAGVADGDGESLEFVSTACGNDKLSYWLYLTSLIPR